MKTKVIKILQGELALPLIRTFFAKGAAALGGLIFLLLLGKLYGPKEVGVFAIAQSIYVGGTILSKYGMENSLMRYVGQDSSSYAILYYLRWALCKGALLGIIAAIAVYTSRFILAGWFNTPELILLLPSIAFIIPPLAIVTILSGFMRGVRQPATACILENGSVMLLATFFIWCISQYTPIDIVCTSYILLMAAWLVMGIGVYLTLHWLKQHTLIEKAQWERRAAFDNTSRAFFIMSLAQFMQQVLGVMIAGLLLSKYDLGMFRSAERSAFLISFALMVINSVLPPRFASLYHLGDLNGLHDLACKGALLGFVLASPLFFICLIEPHLLLELFGEEFSEAANMLRILAVAHMINVITGSVGFLLNMTGHEKLMRNISLICNFAGLLMFFLLIPWLGAIGAAIALSLVLVFQNIVALIFVKKVLNIWILPIPGISRYLS
ncbi:lipopolysaccharide biosynthesis protein [Cobetia amphilecti]|uniref:lipopolysaccharide biosynthesis protein n=1 Tax=Cobetia amphilecti TaxID=1055104 RepID=UPI00244C6D62|nr:oligosaccharide flippase family protein [Cobetia litoralis]MDH2421799.1 polysaccharide biosynthesis C-terminal domain-containing protein [Cobetia litoralis]